MYSWIPKNPQEHKAASQARAMGLTNDIAGFQDLKKAAPFAAAALTNPEADRYVGAVSISGGGADFGWKRLRSFEALYGAETGTPVPSKPACE